MKRSSFVMVLGGLLAPSMALAQTAPQIWAVSRPLNLSQSACIRQANVALRAQRWRPTWSNSTTTNAEANNYSAQILCNAPDRNVTIVVAGPNRNRAQNLAENLLRSNGVWEGGTAVLPQPPVAEFDEQFYLANNPDVAEAVRRRVFPSGLVHYQQFGKNEGRAPRFDEQYYLSRNPDVARAVRRGEYRSGRDHWNQFGINEGRPGGIGSLGQPEGQLSN